VNVGRLPVTVVAVILPGRDLPLCARGRRVTRSVNPRTGLPRECRQFRARNGRFILRAVPGRFDLLTSCAGLTAHPSPPQKHRAKRMAPRVKPAGDGGGWASADSNRPETAVNGLMDVDQCKRRRPHQRGALDKLAALQMFDVHFPVTAQAPLSTAYSCAD
jgi:hypothetical protein